MEPRARYLRRAGRVSRHAAADRRRQAENRTNGLVQRVEVPEQRAGLSGPRARHPLAAARPALTQGSRPLLAPPPAAPDRSVRGPRRHPSGRAGAVPAVARRLRDARTLGAAALAGPRRPGGLARGAGFAVATGVGLLGSVLGDRRVLGEGDAERALAPPRRRLPALRPASWTTRAGSATCTPPRRSKKRALER